MTPVRVFCYAGNHYQAEFFRRDNNLPLDRFRYVDRPERIYGVARGSLLLLYGTWFVRPLHERDEVMAVARYRQLKVAEFQEAPR